MFSIVMPVWNKQRTIAATVASVVAQSFDDFELIAVDDGSTDGSLDLLKTLEDPRIRIVTQPHSGAGPARNAGIVAAQAEWIAFLDADDLWLPDHLAELDRIRRRHPDAGLIGTAYAMQPLNGHVRLLPPQEDGIAAISYFAGMAGPRRPFCTSSSAIAARAYRTVGGFGAFPSGQDVEYFSRIALEWPVAASRRTTTVYNLGTGGISDSMKSPWHAKPLRGARDLLPAVALLIERYPTVRSAETRRGIDLYVDEQFRWCLHRSARIGDLATIRTLRRLYLRRPGWRDRLLLAAARLPGPLAKAVFGAARFGNRLQRRISRS